MTNVDGSINVGGIVPGDLLTDLQRGGVIGDPLYENNFVAYDASGKVQTPVWDSSNFTYTTTFTLGPEVSLAIANKGEVLLVLEGVKMAAEIFLNGVSLGVSQNQFLRFTTPVAKLLAPTQLNVLAVVFMQYADKANADARFMACSGGWDWAPYTGTTVNNGNEQSRTFSKGIWKSVYLVPTTHLAITHLQAHVSYTGPYPTAPLTEATASPFSVSVTVFFWAPKAGGATLSVSSQWNAVSSQHVTFGAGDNNATVTLTAQPAKGEVSLWWPNGMGTHQTYAVSASLAFDGWTESYTSASRKIGFRTIYLVTDDDSSPQTLDGVDGSGNVTMRFKVNGADLYARGGNIIPMEEFEGRLSAAAYVQMVQSAADAHFNVFRIWGGGIFPPEAFYDATDSLGIIIYQDMMFGSDGRLAPSGSANEEAELRHNMRRLSSRASIALWCMCNECGGGGTYESFVAPIVASEDQSRPIWPSCPSKGWASGVNRLTGLPNGKPLKIVSGNSAELKIRGNFSFVRIDKAGAGDSTTGVQARQSCPTFEQHGPYTHGYSKQFPGVNGFNDPVNTNLPPAISLLSPASQGPRTCGQFYSEFGASVFSSFESVAPTLKPKHWALWGGVAPATCQGSGWGRPCIGENPLAQRNYPCDNFIQAYFGDKLDLNATGALSFASQLYCCMVGQALEKKGDIEVRRSNNHFGTITWQLNEIWPTGGWGSLEYGTVGFTAGQVLGGRWKPLHHLMANHLYKDIITVCGSQGFCFLRSDDAINAFSGKVAISLLHIASSKLSLIKSVNVSVPRGAAAFQYFCLGQGSPTLHGGTCEAIASVLTAAGCAADGTDCVLLTNTTDAAGLVKDENWALLTTPAKIAASGVLQPTTKVTIAVSGPQRPDGSIPMTLTADGTALLVVITSLAQGRFEPNLLTLQLGQTDIIFVPFEGFELSQLASTRVEHAALYLQ